jgi:Tol biopolymer transport system component
LLIGFGIGTYFYLKGKREVVDRQAKEGLISEKIMQSPQLSSDKKWLYYYSTAEAPAFYRLELETKKVEKISQDLMDIEEIVYSPDLGKAAFKVTYDKDKFEKYASPFLNPKMQEGQRRYWVVNFKDGGLSHLGENVLNLEFTADSKKIVFLYRSLDNSSINIADPNGENYEKIVDWQSESVVLRAFDDNNFLLISINDESETNSGLYKLMIKEKKALLLTKNYYSSNLYISPSKKNLLFISPIILGQETSTIFFMTDANGQNYQEIITNKDYQFDFSHLAWSKDEKSVYLAAKNKNQENFNNLLKIDLANKILSQLKKEDGSIFEAVDINSEGNLIYYLLNSQLYALKI